MFKKQFMRRIASVFLAMTMLITFAVPSFAFGFDDLTTVIDITGDSPASTESSADDSSSTTPATNPIPPDDPQSGEEPPESSAQKEHKEEVIPLGVSMSEADIIAIVEQKLDNALFTLNKGRMRAASGDTGTVSRTTININSYNVNVPGVGEAWGSVIFRMKINDLEAFCTQIWRIVGGGTYTAGNATSGNDTTAKYLANFKASGKSKADYIATQVLVWESLYGNIGLYNQIITTGGYTSSYNTIAD